MGNGYSLKQYEQKDTAEIQRAKKEFETMRNHKATQQPMQGWKGGIFTYPNDSVNWGVKYTYDSILANNSITSSSVKTSGWEKANNIFGLASAGVALVGTGASIFGSLGAKKTGDGSFNKKETKTIQANTQSVDEIKTALDASIGTAKNINDKTSTDTLYAISNNLTQAISEANKQKGNAENNKRTATATRDNLDAEKTDIETVRTKAEIHKIRLSEELKTLNTQKNDSNLSAEQKAKIEQRIKDIEEEIKELEKTIKENNKKIKEKKEKITVQDEKIKNNQNTINELQKRIDTADKELTNINKKINEKNPELNK